MEMFPIQVDTKREVKGKRRTQKGYILVRKDAFAVLSTSLFFAREQIHFTVKKGYRVR
jgi:hypothetical protein